MLAYLYDIPSGSPFHRQVLSRASEVIHVIFHVRSPYCLRILKAGSNERYIELFEKKQRQGTWKLAWSSPWWYLLCLLLTWCAHRMSTLLCVKNHSKIFCVEYMLKSTGSGSFNQIWYRWVCLVSSSFPTVKTLHLSALNLRKWKTLDFTVSGRSMIWITNRSGPRTHPCGIPLKTGAENDSSPLTLGQDKKIID